VRRGFDSSKKLAGLGETETDLVRQILNSSLPPEEKTVWRVTRESSGVTLAGTETTGSVLTVMVYHLLAQPEKAEKLREELKEAYQKYERPPTYQELKELPYLVRCSPLRILGLRSPEVTKISVMTGWCYQRRLENGQCRWTSPEI